MTKTTLLGYRVWSGRVQACAADMVRWVTAGTSCKTVLCINPHSYAVSKQNAVFAAALERADWLLPDGIGMALAFLFSGSRPSRVTGSDVFAEVNRHLQTLKTGSVYFLGSTPEVLEAICRRFAVEYPEVRIAGAHSPPFRNEFSEQDLAECLRLIERSGADVLYVGMSAPKQEMFIHRLHDRLPVKLALGIGAVFDYYAQTRRRPGPIMRMLGLEWLGRLLQEPRRLWRRTFCSAPVFLVDALMRSRR